jgi:hypothetical protein
MTHDQWPIQKTHEYKFGSHQNWNLYRMVSTSSYTVSPRPDAKKLKGFRWFMYIPSKLDFSDLTDILAL